MPVEQKNVFAEPLKQCSQAPLTGFQRDGFCHLSEIDFGQHGVCAVLTEEFLSYTASQGNDLTTPRPEFNFPGLKVGDYWCLCIERWLEAHAQGVAPNLYLAGCHENLLHSISLAELNNYAVTVEL